MPPHCHPRSLLSSPRRRGSIPRAATSRMKRKKMTLKRILAPPAHEEELQRDEWIPAFAGMTAEGGDDSRGRG